MESEAPALPARSHSVWILLPGGIVPFDVQLQARRRIEPAGAPCCMAITVSTHFGPELKRWGYLRLLGLKSSEERDA